MSLSCRICAASSPPSASRGGDRVQARRHDHHRQRKFLEDARLHAGGSSAASITACSSSPPTRAAPSIGSSGKSLAAANSTAGRVQADRQGRQGDLDPGELQRDPRSQRPAVQGREIRHRHHRAEDAATWTSRASSPRSTSRRRSSSSRSTGRSRPRTRTSWARWVTRLDEVVGRHHSMFVEPGLRAERRISRVLGQARARRVRRQSVQAVRQGRQGDLDSGELQSDPRCQRQAVQGRQIRHRRHRHGEGRARRPARS